MPHHLFTMVRALLVVIILLVSVESEAQYRVNERRSVAWDHDNIGIITFQISLDSGAWTDIGVSNQWLIPILPAGHHNVRVRACDIGGCGQDASLNFIILPLMPTIPGNLRLFFAPQTVSIEQAIEVAHSYSYLWRLVRLSDFELQFIASQYNGSPNPTLGEIINFLETIFVGFAR